MTNTLNRSVVNTAPGSVFTTLHFLHDPKARVLPWTWLERLPGTNTLAYSADW